MQLGQPSVQQEAWVLIQALPSVPLSALGQVPPLWASVSSDVTQRS